MSMIFEHVGMTVSAPHAMADWYCETFGVEILERWGSDSGAASAAFVRFAPGAPPLELFEIDEITPLAHSLAHPLQLHLAFQSDDPDRDCERLIARGAVFVQVCPTPSPSDKLLLLRDPWGNSIQLVKRGGTLNLPRANLPRA